MVDDVSRQTAEGCLESAAPLSLVSFVQDPASLPLPKPVPPPVKRPRGPKSPTTWKGPVPLKHGILCESSRARKAREAILSTLGGQGRQVCLGRRGFQSLPPVPQEQLLDACRKWRISLRDLERLALPDWNFDAAFASREAFLEYLEPLAESGGARTWAKIAPGQLFGCFEGVRFQDGLCSARWAELSVGSVVARLMTDPFPTSVNAKDLTVAHAVLAGLRKIVVWSPEVNFALRSRTRRRMVFLAWVGRDLGLEPMWTTQVLPFL